jgi:hypothetical protein
MNQSPATNTRSKTKRFSLAQQATPKASQQRPVDLATMKTPTPEDSSSNATAADLDFECDAPKFVDFTAEAPQTPLDVDRWFGAVECLFYLFSIYVIS